MKEQCRWSAEVLMEPRVTKSDRSSRRDLHPGNCDGGTPRQQVLAAELAQAAEGAGTKGAGINESRNSGAVVQRLDRRRPGRMIRKGRKVHPPTALGGATRDTSSAPAEPILRGRSSAPHVLSCPGATSAAARGHIPASTSGASEAAESSCQNPQGMQTGIIALGGCKNPPFVAVCLPPRPGVTSLLEPGCDGAMALVCP